MRENNGDGSGLTPGQVAEWLREAAGHIKGAGEDYEQLHWYTVGNEFAKIADNLLERAAQVEAIPDWNTRNPDPVKAELVEALKDMLHHAYEEDWDRGGVVGHDCIEAAEAALKKAGIQDL